MGQVEKMASALGLQPAPTFAEMLKAAEGGPELGGHMLTDKADLVGVPFIATAVNFRESDVRRPDGSLAPEYVSVEALTEKARVVFNDGSTGVRRQVLQLLAMLGILLPGDGAEPDAPLFPQLDDGTMGVDLNRVVWGPAEPGRKRSMIVTFPEPGVPARHGLRVSEYDGPQGGKSRTYYFA